jgi:acyl-coenzyme A thioesterase 13
MKTIDRVSALKSFIGQEFTASPSPFMHWLKPIVLSAEIGKLAFQYEVRKEMTNPIGTLHGGVIAAIIDDILGATMFSLNEEHFYTTINNVIDYFSPGREGDVIIAETSILKKGKQIVNAQCEVWNADRSRLLARGSSNLMKTEMVR